jgi:hypothetical protein
MVSTEIQLFSSFLLLRILFSVVRSPVSSNKKSSAQIQLELALLSFAQGIVYSMGSRVCAMMN